jgi:membrane protein YdbS with pleckstrin-like domain
MKLYSGEKRIAVYRKHVIYVVTRAIGFFILGALPSLALKLLTHFSLIHIFSGYIPYLELANTIWILFAWVGFFISWTNYMLDSWVLTSERLVDIDQQSLFTRSVATLRLEDIQDVTVESRGIFDELFGMGLVKVQTAGASEEFKIPDVARPNLVRDKILEAVHALKNKKEV